MENQRNRSSIFCFSLSWSHTVDRMLNLSQICGKNHLSLLNKVLKIRVDNRACALKYHLIKSESAKLHVHPGWWHFSVYEKKDSTTRNFTVQTLQFRSPPFKATLSSYWAGSVLLLHSTTQSCLTNPVKQGLS